MFPPSPFLPPQSGKSVVDGLRADEIHDSGWNDPPPYDEYIPTALRVERERNAH